MATIVLQKRKGSIGKSVFFLACILLLLGTQFNGLCAVCLASKPVDRGARIFITKTYPAKGKLSDNDFRQLADAGFTVVAVRWLGSASEDMAVYCQRAAKAGLDVMKWGGGMASAEGDDRVVNRHGKTTKYTIPYSPRGWNKITEHAIEAAKLALKYPNYKGVIFDYEIYDKNKTDGFCESYDDQSFANFLASVGHIVPNPLTPPAERWDHLKKYGLLGMFVGYQSELLAEQVQIFRRKLDAVNPDFQIGTYGWGVLFDVVAENVATQQAPVLIFNAATYGRTHFSNAFSGGYDAAEPDRRGLKWALITNASLARNVRDRQYPAVFLGGHYPQSPGPKDGLQYKFTVRQAFNSAVYADGYWIWTDPHTQKPWKSKQQWIDAMMAYFQQANAAIDAGDYAWSSRQSDLVANPEATKPNRIVTIAKNGTISAWDPITGKKASSPGKTEVNATSALFEGKPLRINGHYVNLTDHEDGKVLKQFYVGQGIVAIAVADVDALAGDEVVTLNAGWVKIWDPESTVMLLKFYVGNDQNRLYLISK